MLKLQVPGKLFLAGEFAATYTNQPSIIMAIDRYIEFKITAAETIEINSDLLGTYQISNNKLQPILKAQNDDWSLIQAGLQTFEQFRRDLPNAPELKPFHLSIESHLNLNQRKIGLGSSGATMVGLIASLLQFHQISFSKIMLFKLATIALLKIPKFSNGSMGDVAAASFGGVVYYHKFDRTWVQKMLQNDHLANLVQIPWPHLVLKNMPFPTTWQLLVGWTQSPADTQSSLDTMQRQKQLDQHFLQASSDLVWAIQKAISQKNWSDFRLKLSEIQLLLIKYTNAQHLPYQTPALTAFLNSLEHFNLPGKISGAGNGDNGIAFQLLPAPNLDLLATWRNQGIQPLPLKIAPAKGISYGI
ncbi:phosphomevalonate kinase [Weissella coleopterorum]|uniref:phosphomevalonate kinase n=1 Tax=Weissella coleopterorum TaxID=2714949 RepID=A0A6G8B137_9LACO|nr:phosphomevalonate kinase [Weissella coleopterorum]QIL50843.1 phosphomevalonate kinase [Weissella coleopterorum]